MKMLDGGDDEYSAALRIQVKAPWLVVNGEAKYESLFLSYHM